MDTKCNDAVFGDMTYKHRWFKDDVISLFGKDYNITTVAKAYSGKAITEEQRTAYKSFVAKKKEYADVIATAITDYVNSNLQELAEYWVSARRIERKEDLIELVTPKTLLFKQDGTTLVLLECAWDIENGVAVKLAPEMAVGSQDLFL